MAYAQAQIAGGGEVPDLTPTYSIFRHRPLQQPLCSDSAALFQREWNVSHDRQGTPAVQWARAGTLHVQAREHAA